VNHHRPYLTIRAQLTRLVNHAMTHKQLTTTHKDYSLLNTVITQSASKIDFTAFGLNTKKQVEKHLKWVVEELLRSRA
jgi:tRNA(Met) cytidine acetyltransferase